MDVNKSFIFTFFAITILQTALLLLKLFKVIDWSWGWILAPLWIPYALFIIGITIIMGHVIIIDIKERKSSDNG